MSMVNAVKTTIVAAALSMAALSASQAGVVSALNTTYGAVDLGSFDRTFSINSAGQAVQDVDIAIFFAKCDDPAIPSGAASCSGGGFSFNREIQFRLRSPGGTIVDLVLQDTYDGQTPGALATITFDDEAASTVGGALLLSGSFRPVTPLSAFDGQGADGIWTLTVEDTVGADPLMFFSANLCITVPNGGTSGACTIEGTGSTTEAPEPASLALLGAGLLGLGALRRRRD